VEILRPIASHCFHFKCYGPLEAKKPTSIREFEHALRALGFSQNESKAIAKRGFKAVSTAADDADELEQLATLLKRNVQILKD
jgi:hypothetical protein